MKLSRAIAEFLADKRSGHSPQTVIGYSSDLHRLLMMVQIDTVLHVTPELIREYFHQMSGRGLSQSTLHRRRATLSEFIKFGMRDGVGLWPVSVGLKLAANLPRISRPKLVPRPFSKDETDRLVALPLPPLESLVRKILFFSGLRVSSVSNLKLGDFDNNPPVIRTLGKGAKVQVLPLHPELQAEVLAYIADRDHLKAHNFLVAYPNGRQLRRRAIEKMTTRWGNCGRETYHAQVKQCDLCAQVPECVPHRFRHTFATRLLEQSKNIRVVQEALGHGDVSTTMIYTKVTDSILADAVRSLRMGPEKPPEGK